MVAKVHNLGQLPLHNPQEGPNCSLTIPYDGDGNPQYWDKTIGCTTWRKTFTWVDGQLTAISEWIKQ